MLTGKLESAFWFLRRPRLFPQFLHLVKLKLFSRPEPDTRAEAERWCEQRAIGVGEAIERVTGSKMDGPVAEKFKAVFEEARSRAESSPVRMGGPGALDLLYWTALRLKAREAVETGVAYGWSSLAILLAQRELPGSRLVSTDMPYLKAGNDAYVGIVIPETLRSGWELIRLPDRQALPGALRRQGVIDFCHYDSDKTYMGRMWAYPRLWSALRAGGCFISDDIGDNVGFRDFALDLGVEPIVVRVPEESPAGSRHAQVKYVGVLLKS